jgi:hypothetical protein
MEVKRFYWVNSHLADDVDGYLFGTARHKTGQLTANTLFQQDVHRIIMPADFCACYTAHG